MALSVLMYMCVASSTHNVYSTLTLTFSTVAIAMNAYALANAVL